jgi:hypothetical protein
MSPRYQNKHLTQAPLQVLPAPNQTEDPKVRALDALLFFVFVFYACIYGVCGVLVARVERLGVYVYFNVTCCCLVTKSEALLKAEQTFQSILATFTKDGEVMTFLNYMENLLKNDYGMSILGWCKPQIPFPKGRWHLSSVHFLHTLLTNSCLRFFRIATAVER